MSPRRCPVANSQNARSLNSMSSPSACVPGCGTGSEIRAGTQVVQGRRHAVDRQPGAALPPRSGGPRSRRPGPPSAGLGILEQGELRRGVVEADVAPVIEERHPGILRRAIGQPSSPSRSDDRPEPADHCRTTDGVLESERAVRVLGDVLEVGGHGRDRGRGARRRAHGSAGPAPSRRRQVDDRCRLLATMPGSASAASKRATAVSKISPSVCGRAVDASLALHPAEGHAGAKVSPKKT